MALSRVVVARPYDRRIRERMFESLNRAGLEIDARDVIAGGTPDPEVSERLSASGAYVLLVPFHAHRDSGGQVVNGLDFLRYLSETKPGAVRRPILMPISSAGMAAASLMLTKSGQPGDLDDELTQRVLFLPEAELDDPGLARRIRVHVDTHA